MPRNEAETRSQLINPAIQCRGWVWPLLREEQSARRIDIIDGQPVLSRIGRIDYLLRVQVNTESEPVPVAILEAKSEDHTPDHGLEQAKLYAECERLNVPLVISSNGHRWVSFNRTTGETSQPRSMDDFPTPTDLRALYESTVGFRLDEEVARPLITPYSALGEQRRYYQDAAIRAVLEKIARCEKTNQPKRALLSLATGAGKTFIATALLRRIADAGQLRRALFVCDRTELRSQALGSLQGAFTSDAAQVEEEDGDNKARNARVHVATFQTLDIDKEEQDQEEKTANFLTKHYPPDYFSHIIIDECHRSAWGKWSQVLKRNPSAVQIGLTATPREIKVCEDNPEARADEKISRDNLRYFGEPVYEYTMAQAMDDGYLAACEVIKATINIDDTGLTIDQIMALGPTDQVTGRALSRNEIEQLYTARSFEQKIQLPDRVHLMCRDLFDQILARDGDPHQKTIVFCASDLHAQAVANKLGNLYADWCRANNIRPKSFYAFKCTAESSGNDQLPDFKGARGSHFIATTVDLLTTGVDVPVVRNIAFFKYVNSPISFYQMVGRGTRIDIATGKLMFRVYDYTNATRLFGEKFVTAPPRDKKGDSPPRPSPPPKPVVTVSGLAVHVDTRGHLIVTSIDGKAAPIPVDEYRQRLHDKLLAEVATLDEFRRRWCDRSQRAELLYALPGGEASALLLREIDSRENYDLYDVLANLAYDLEPLPRMIRAGKFQWVASPWLQPMPAKTRDVIRGLANQFALGGTDALEDRRVFETPDILRAGGLAALQLYGEPHQLLRETKERLFAA